MQVSRYFRVFPSKGDQPAVALNTRTGGSYSLDDVALSRLSKFLESPNYDADDGFRSFLVDQEILIDDGVDELEMVKTKYRRDRHSLEELYITYSMTNACNFRCTYCYQEHKADVLEGENLDKTIRYVERELPAYSRLKVHWFGGEPTLRLRWIESTSNQLLKLCDGMSKDYFAGITTNGSLFNTETAKTLKACKVRQVQFTLDGDQSDHDRFRIHKDGSGTFESVMAGIKTSVAHGFVTFVRVNISPKNVDRLERLLDRFESEGMGPRNLLVYLNEMKEHTNSLHATSLYFSSIEKYGEALVKSLAALKRRGYAVPSIGPVDVNCQFDKPSSVLFGVDGNLYHCTTGTDKALARLDASGAVAESTARREFVHGREPWDDPTCASCPNLPSCMGGCAYLDEEGKVKCNPEGFVIEELLRLKLT